MSQFATVEDGFDPALEQKELTRFEAADEYMRVLDVFLASPSEAQLKPLVSMLDEYQEQSYLLDPFLERMVSPPVKTLQDAIRSLVAGQNAGSSLTGVGSETERLARLLYFYTKVRGYKTIVHFFPHSVEDLSPALASLEAFTLSTSSDGSGAGWELRYIMLLWLSLVCMIPFDLHKFDGASGSIAQRIEEVGKSFLASSGKERDAAAVMLGKLFQRRDAVSDQLERFLGWCHAQLTPPSRPSAFLITGIFQALCEIVKTSDAVAIAPRLPALNAILDIYSPPLDDDEAVAALENDPARAVILRNSLVSKFRTKLTCRLGMKVLRPRRRTRFVSAKVLGEPSRSAATGASGAAGAAAGEEQDDEEDVPEEVEPCIARLISALQDKDTVVRYSAAKGLSRLCSRLPGHFIDQIADAVTSLFAINVADIMGAANDLNAVSEHTWQGACLALAEMGRRGLLRGEELGEKLEWVQKALLFDVRRGSHSVGTGVRDAACYVLWALARAHDAEALRPFALQLARRLVTVACLDRDISIRRAASAAFQECVGRLGLFPHGIDVMRMTDFFAVSVRRNAFLECAPQVAAYEEYRNELLKHLLTVTVVHWDVAMRELAAQSVARIVAIDLETLAPPIVSRMAEKCKSRDTHVLHGVLLTLGALGIVCSTKDGEVADSLRFKIFASLSNVSPPSLRTTGSSYVLLAACQLIASSVSVEGLQAAGSLKPVWDSFIGASLARQEEEVHEAASLALRAISALQDCSSRVQQLESSWPTLTPAEQQSNALVLGAYDYARFSAGFESSQRFLLTLVDAKLARFSARIETRRNAYHSLVSSIIGLGARLPEVLGQELGRSTFAALLAGLDDYTTDQRGDVGSWVRLACVHGLRKLTDVYREQSAALTLLEEWLPESMFHSVIAGLLKQTVERIDNVRAQAGEQLLALCRAAADAGEAFHAPQGMQLIDQVFPRNEPMEFKQPAWLFPRAVKLLALPLYRSPLLLGIVLSLGSKTEMGHRVVAASLTDYALALPPTSSDDATLPSYSSVALLRDVRELAVSHYTSNRTFIPALQTLSVLLESGLIAERLASHADAQAQLQRALTLCTRNVGRMKSAQRLGAAMALCVNLVRVPELRADALRACVAFLGHAFPTLRGATSEALYLVLQDCADGELGEEAEEVLLSTPWAERREGNFAEEAERLVELLVHELA